MELLEIILKNVVSKNVFSGLASLKMKCLKKNLRVSYVYIEESFDTIFTMGYGGGGGRTTPLQFGYGSIKSPKQKKTQKLEKVKFEAFFWPRISKLKQI